MMPTDVIIAQFRRRTIGTADSRPYCEHGSSYNLSSYNFTDALDSIKCKNLMQIQSILKVIYINEKKKKGKMKEIFWESI